MNDVNLSELIDNTWRAERFEQLGPWTLRLTKGAGSRVSAATLAGESGDIDAAEAAMRTHGQKPLIMVQPHQTALDAQLDARGYVKFDATNFYTCPIERLTDTPLPRVRVLSVWEPLAIMREIWATGGIGPDRIDVMMRATGPHMGLLARQNDHPGGAGFVAVHNDTAMVHALEILPHQRRQGLAQWMMRGAAIWAAGQGARTMSVLCTQANGPANALYQGLGMKIVGQYHYRGLDRDMSK